MMNYVQYSVIYSDNAGIPVYAEKARVAGSG